MSKHVDQLSRTATARRIRVPFNFSRLRDTMKRTFALAPGEQRIERGLITVRRLGLLGGPGLALLTDRRLCLLVHYAFRPDRGFEFPRGSLVAVRRVNLFPTVWFLRLTYRTSDGLAHLDISDVQVLTAATAAMGQPVKARHLVEAIERSWGTEAPAVESM